VFSTGHIYYFSSFRFNDGGTPKEKYFIVLKNTKDGLIVGTLPTRKNKVEAFDTIEHGCINIDNRLYNCYKFQHKKIICTNGFCFDLPTFIYGGDIKLYDGVKMEADNKEGVDFALQGVLTQEEYTQVIECLTKSNAVKNGIKRKLTA
jgi:hypothetical protein